MNMKNTSKNPAIKNDYQMNVEIADKIIEIIESGDVQRWRKTWTTTSGKGASTIYNLVLEGMAAVNVYTMQCYNPLLVEAGFYVTFKQIKDNKLHLKKGAKGVANYKPCSFYKYLTTAEQEALALEIENKEELKEEIKELMEGKNQVLKFLSSTKMLKATKENLTKLWNGTADNKNLFIVNSNSYLNIYSELKTVKLM